MVEQMAQEVSFDEKMHANAVHFLLSEKESEAALILLSCAVELDAVDNNWNGVAYSVYIKGPRYVYDILKKGEEHPVTRNIEAAFNAVLPARDYVKYIIPSINLIDVEPG